MPSERHVTTRRGFIAAMGFGAVSLYGVWAAYGAAPLPFGSSREATTPRADGYGGHGGAPEMLTETPAEAAGHGAHGGPGAMSPEEFRLRHERFLRDYARADGSVDLAADQDAHASGRHGHAHGDSDHGASAAPANLYLLAYKWGYDPLEIRLRAGVPYRLRMMADDVTHGASLQLGRGSRIIRLRPNVVSEQTVVFERPGPVLVYCTVYCGQAHDAMQGRIVVA